jgi:hypothetical protein
MFEKIISNVTIDDSEDKIVRKKCMIYPDNTIRVIWELYINLLLLVISIITPYQLAFSSTNDKLTSTQTSNFNINYLIDLCFLIDVIVTFFMASENNFHEINDDRKVIAKDYLKGWFTIDVLSIFPFDVLAASQSSDYNQLLRLAKFSRLYKLVKLTKLLRLVKIIKN